MKGLLIKDMWMTKRTLMLYALLIIVLAVANESAVMFAMFYSLMLPVNLLALDERSRFDRLVPMLPLSNLQCVLDKYLISYASIAILSVLAGIITAVRAGTPALSPVLMLGAGITLMAHAVSIPLLIRFGVERGRMIYLIVLIAEAALLGAGIAFLEENMRGTIVLLSGMVLAAGMVLSLLSIPVAMKMFEKQTLA
ncbi:MAG TPA: ABC-2 transporter permease [Candidatus Ventricola intestinavium]|nr:ABC-2 transporter permease [Candidatus Ventricola intestinavium]